MSGSQCKRKTKGEFCYDHQPCELCAVCTEEVNEPPLECGHYIHRKCIINWGKAICPLCRQSVKLDDESFKKLEEIGDQRRQESIREDEEELVREFANELMMSLPFLNMFNQEPAISSFSVNPEEETIEDILERMNGEQLFERMADQFITVSFLTLNNE